MQIRAHGCQDITNFNPAKSIALQQPLQARVCPRAQAICTSHKILFNLINHKHVTYDKSAIFLLHLTHWLKDATNNTVIPSSILGWPALSISSSILHSLQFYKDYNKKLLKLPMRKMSLYPIIKPKSFEKKNVIKLQS